MRACMELRTLAVVIAAVGAAAVGGCSSAPRRVIQAVAEGARDAATIPSSRRASSGL
jgi:hypothetical protein